MAEHKKQRRHGGRHIYDPALVDQLLAEREQSGESYVALSSRSGVPAPTLGWHSRRRKRGARSKFVEVVITPSDAEVAVVHAAPDLRVAVLPHAGGREVIVPRGFDADELRRLITALEQ